MSDMEFKKKLKTLPLVSGEVNHAPERVVQVLKSPIFLQLVTGSPKLRFALVDFIETQTSLNGDPVNWTIEYGPRFGQWQISDGTSKIEMEYHDGYDLHRKVFTVEYYLSVLDSFDPNHKYFSVDYYMRKSSFFAGIPIPNNCYAWTVFPADNNTSRVNLIISMRVPNQQANVYLLDALNYFTAINDMAIHRAQKLEEKAKRAEKVRLEQEIVLAEQRIQSLKEQDYLARESSRRNRDQCLSCGAACVQRRRKSDGHLFFGCSKYFTTSCKGAHSIPCPKCGLEMIERRRKEGGTFLGCTGWPGCNGSRTVDARLASERGVGTRKADTRKSYLSREEREEAKAYIDALDEANSHDEEGAWWEEWGDRVHSDDPRETPQYYDHRLLDRWREDPDIP